MIAHRDRFLEIVRKPRDSKEAANVTECFLIVELTDGGSYDMSQDYFRLMFARGVKPTNNHSEQQVRRRVCARQDVALFEMLTRQAIASRGLRVRV